MEYAQARTTSIASRPNYINAMGRLAEAEGESRIYQDLRMKLFIGPRRAEEGLRGQPAWLRKLMDAFADGLNFYLYRHLREVKPRVIPRFEPWMALSFTEGSIGGDIETVNLSQLAAFYGQTAEERYQGRPAAPTALPSRPPNTAAHHALLLINPHTSFYFRSELQMSSGEGLDAYGAVTWGQFFIYQGFNGRGRLDAYLERRGCGRRISGNGREDGQPVRLQNTGARSAP